VILDAGEDLDGHRIQMLPKTDGAKEAEIEIDFQEPGKSLPSFETTAR